MSGSIIVILGLSGLFVILFSFRSLARNRQHAGRAEERLRSTLLSQRSPQEYTFQGLYEAVLPPSAEWLALAVARMLDATIGWHRVFRVVFPDWSTRFMDFTSIEAIPEQIEMSEGRSFLVEPHLVKIVFKNDHYRGDDPRSGPTSPPSPSKGRAAAVPKLAVVPNPAAPPKPAAPEPVKVPEPVAGHYE